MKIIDIIENIETYGEEMTIYAQKPWTENSLAILDKEPEDGQIPPNAQKNGCAYFLEIIIAKEFLGDYMANVNPEPSSIEKAKRIIYYAVHDA